ncbi:hypothetical protein [Lactococcus allomyrinae]|uniref:Uncharacterized protein n=1 Tax=Lactococcus allomyrinae TaxID=2419773 RepID=A0A387BFD6_9LACT|nr:hypothetical protein [Lactococcus allomyrinae]AYG01308.1 hypothetical protein D7I46_09500 [Lactococcus allomyrinae]
MVEKMTLGIGATNWFSTVFLMFIAIVLMSRLLGVRSENLENRKERYILFVIGALISIVTLVGFFSPTTLTKKVTVTENKYQVVNTEGSLLSNQDFNVLLKNTDGTLIRKSVNFRAVKIKEGENFSYFEKVEQITYKTSNILGAFFKEIPRDENKRTVSLTIPQDSLKKQ